MNATHKPTHGGYPDAVRDDLCAACGGEGWVQAMTSHLGPDDYEYAEDCEKCNGSGSSRLSDALATVPYIAHSITPARKYMDRDKTLKIVKLHEK